eukprot:TRINITY_DN3800_c0_g1_i1.p1 TRINITY_DN3800_c0_g1~~TRINITY_DN3800_c0_g1_i1.p1  ORF type:complete len:133 (+),score=11.76 TRINITY_DN3800_c0_g1_i1:1-399(+)
MQLFCVDKLLVSTDSENIFLQLLLCARLFHQLPLHSSFSLSLTSSALLKAIRPSINDNYFFHYAKEREFEIYPPKNIKVSSKVNEYPAFVKFIKFERDFNFAVGTLPTNLTHIYFGWHCNKPPQPSRLLSHI